MSDNFFRCERCVWTTFTKTPQPLMQAPCTEHLRRHNCTFKRAALRFRFCAVTRIEYHGGASASSSWFSNIACDALATVCASAECVTLHISFWFCSRRCNCQLELVLRDCTSMLTKVFFYGHEILVHMLLNSRHHRACHTPPPEGGAWAMFPQ